MRRCLILDDEEDIEGTISAYRKTLCNHETIQYDTIGVMPNDDYMPDFNLTLKNVLEKMHTEKYDLFACDMQLGLGEEYGYDIVQQVCRHFYSLPIILYSGDFTSLATLLAERLRNPNGGKAKDVLYALSHIKKIVDRAEDLEDHILSVLNDNTSVYQVFQALLRENSALVMNVGFSGFQGKTFGEIATALNDEKHNANVHRFVEDIIEHAIHHLGSLNKNA